MPNLDINTVARKYELSLEVLNPIYARGNENARYYRGDNWTQRDLKEHRSQGFFHAYAIPLIGMYLNKILSVQRSNRFETKCRGRGQEDELTSEILNNILKFVDDDTKYKWIESFIFQDAISKIYGVLKIFPDYTINPRGEIAQKKIQFDEFFWDTNATSYNPADTGTFVGESCWFSLDTAQQMYPNYEWAKQGWFGGETVNMDYGNGLKKKNWYDEKTREVRINEQYNQDYKRKYLVKNIVTGDFNRANSEAEAQEYMQRQIQSEIEQVKSKETYDRTFSAEDFNVIPKQLKVWNKIVYTGNNLLEESEHKYSKPPYFRYSALFDDGEMWSLVDLAKDPQKWFDRLTSMMDKSTAKNIKGNNYTMIPEKMHPSELKDATALMSKASSGGYIFKVTSHDAIQGMERQNDIRVESQLAQAAQGWVLDILGGASYHGLEADVNQTATEVSINNQNAKQTGMLYVDNLALFSHQATEYRLEVIKDIYTPDRSVRVMGEVTSKEVMEAFDKAGIYTKSSLYPGEYGYMDLSKLAQPLQDCNLDIIIDDVNATVSEKERKFIQVMAVNEQEIKSGMPPLSADIRMYYANVDPTVKNMIIKDREQAQQQAMMQQEAQMDLQKADTLSKIISQTKPQEKPAMNGVVK